VLVAMEEMFQPEQSTNQRNGPRLPGLEEVMEEGISDGARQGKVRRKCGGRKRGWAMYE